MLFFTYSKNSWRPQHAPRGLHRLTAAVTVAAAATIFASTPRASAAVAGTVFTFTGVKSNLWNDPTTANSVTVQPNWSPAAQPPAPPNSATADVFIPSPFTVNVNGNFIAGAITVSSGAGLTLPSGDSLTIDPGAFTTSDNGVIANAGTITVDPGSILGNSSFSSTVTLNGGGSVVLNEGFFGSNNYGSEGPFVNANNTISGAGAIEASNGAATIAFNNAGIVDADVLYNANANSQMGNALLLQGNAFSAPILNTGTLEATGGGRLNILGSVNNSGGTIFAGNGAIVELAGMISGGQLTSTGSGVINLSPTVQTILSSLSTSANIDVLPGSGLLLNGVITNTGTITCNGDGIYASSSGVTLSGGGTVDLTGVGRQIVSGGYGPGASGLTNQGNTIEGVGTISSYNNTAFTNAGTVDANVAYSPTTNNALSITCPTTNTGVIEASNGGQLQFGGNSPPINNTGGTIEAMTGSSIVMSGDGVAITGGTIEALSGSSIVIDGYGDTITGSTLTNGGTGTITVGGGTLTLGVTLSNVTNTGTFIANGMYLSGTINNIGSISFAPGRGSVISLSSNTTLTGGGVINLSPLDAITISNYLFTNQSNVIQGDGYVYSGGSFMSGFVNNATVDADTPFVPANNNALQIQAALANAGTLEATNGGELIITSNTTNNAGGTIEALNGSTVVIEGGDVTGGTITTAGTGIVQGIAAGGGPGLTLDSLTNAGNLQLSASVFLANTINNTGTITAAARCQLGATGVATLTGGGTLILQQGATAGGNSSAGAGLINQNNTIQGTGAIGNAYGFQFTNRGTIIATDAANNLVLAGPVLNDATGIIRAAGAAGITMYSGSITNLGTFQVENGSAFSIANNSPPLLTNYNPTTETLNGGTYQVFSTGAMTTLNLGGRPIVTNNANITLSGAASVFADINGLANNQGTFQLLNGRAFTTASTLTNSGTIAVGAGSALTVAGDLPGGGTFNDSGSATVNSFAQQNVAITNGGVLNVATAATDGAVTNSADSLIIDTAHGGALNLNNTNLIIHYGAGASPDQTIRSYLTSGYNGGAWTGPGINSASAAASNGVYSLGYADGADGVVAGLASGDVLIKYTLAGDADMDGKVDFNDFLILESHFGKSGMQWDQGNFTYGSTVNFADFLLLETNFGKSLPGVNAVQITSAQLAAINAFANSIGAPPVSQTTIPEPATLGLLALGSLGLVRRRRRRAC